MSLVNVDTGEVVTLADCEAVIERGRQTFIEVGQALAAIRDNDLYRHTHDTFEDYCRDRWGFRRQHAWRMIEASEIVGMLPASPIGDAPNEAQVRELAPLKDNPDEMVAAWDQAQAQAESGERRMTARDVRDSVQPRVAPDLPVEDAKQAEEDAELLEKVGEHLAENVPELVENQSYRDASQALRSAWATLKEVDPVAAGRGCQRWQAGDLFMEKVDAIEEWLTAFRRAQNPMRLVKGER